MRAILRDTELLRGTVQGYAFERENRSEEYVEIPPAFVITDERGGMWSLGNEYRVWKGYYEFPVIRNDVFTGEWAQKIVKQRGRVRIFGADGWRVWNGRVFV